jgi:hypothetical protein
MEDIKLELNLDKIIPQLNDIKLDSKNIIETLHKVMEIVEKIDNTLKGINKKNLVMNCIKHLIEKRNDLSEKEKELLNSSVETIVPQAIDVIVAVSNGISILVKKSSCCPFFL